MVARSENETEVISLLSLFRRLHIRRAGTWDTAAIDRLRFRHVGTESETEKDAGRRGMAQARHLLEHGGLIKLNDEIFKNLEIEICIIFVGTDREIDHRLLQVGGHL